MRSARYCLLPALLLAFLGSGATNTIDDAFLHTELFPVLPGVDTQRGFAVAADGDRLAVGAPLENAVYLFQWIGQQWVLETTLSPDPGTKGRFGHALALRGGTLAVSALGEGAVYVYQQIGEEWSTPVRFSGKPGTPGQPGRFGRSMALGGGRLAVGESAPHGDKPGAVWVYTPLGPSWSAGADVRKAVAPGNRFGEAVALDGDTLVAGDPADRESRGKVRVFRVVTGQPPIPLQELTAADGRPGDQLGAAVDLSGDRLAIGAPTAGESSGAVYVVRRTGNAWGTPERLVVAGLRRHDQLGMAVALEGDLLAAGAPAPVTQEGRPGSVHVFRFMADRWNEAAVLQPDNGEPRDLIGFAVAVRGNRIAVGAALGDQGGGAAGAAWTFTCGPPDECAQEGEALVSDPAAGDHVGTAVALSGDRLAVGAPADGVGGAVYVYRRAGTGWRQEARLTSRSPLLSNGFGSALAMDGDTLAVGSPRDHEGPQVSPPVESAGGLVYLYHRDGITWSLEVILDPSDGRGGSFGAALSLSGGALAVGAPTSTARGIDAGAVSIYRRTASGWSPDPLVTAPDGQPGDRFGTAVAVQGGTLAVGSPSSHSFQINLARLGDLPGDGAVYLFTSGVSGWNLVNRLEAPLFQGRFGAALSLDGGTLAVGAPGSAPGSGGLVHLFTGSPWTLQGPPLSAPGAHRFGAALALRGGELLIGAPGTGKAADPAGEVGLYRRNGVLWSFAGSFVARTPVHGDAFGAALALGEDGTFAVGSPGPFAGHSVNVFSPIPEDQP
jgi:hypothetical protein